jgi:predicted double-glycine peptidase
VVVNLTASSVTVYDPEKGARVFTRQTFTAAWDIQNNLAIIVMA